MQFVYLIHNEVTGKPSTTRSILILGPPRYHSEDYPGIIYSGSNRPGDNVWTKRFIKNNMTPLKECKDD